MRFVDVTFLMATARFPSSSSMTRSISRRVAVRDRFHYFLDVYFNHWLAPDKFSVQLMAERTALIAL